MICENCSNKHNGKYGSGRFCCSKCARGFSTRAKRQEINQKVSKKIKGTKLNLSDEQRKAISERFKKNKGRKFSEEAKENMRKGALKRAPASLETRQKLSKSLKGKTGGFKNFGGSGKKGTFEGYLYQSSWELIFIKYCLNNGIKFRRCNEHFDYVFEGKKHKYYPDFYLIDEERYVEVKGFPSKRTDAKIQSVRDKGFKIDVLGKEEICKMGW